MKKNNLKINKFTIIILIIVIILIVGFLVYQRERELKDQTFYSRITFNGHLIPKCLDNVSINNLIKLSCNQSPYIVALEGLSHCQSFKLGKYRKKEDYGQEWEFVK